MASTYENDLRLEEMATGENSGSWGTKTNTNLELVADAFSYGTEIIANADTAITIADGAADAARSLALKITSSEDLTTTRVVTLGPNTTSKVWIIENSTSGGQVLTISAGSGSNVTLLNGQTKIIATDGIGAGSNVVELTQDIAIADLFIDDDLSLQSDGAVINFGADADVRLTHVADTGLRLNDAMALEFRDGDLSINSSADGQLDIDADTEIEIVAPTVDIDASTAMTVDTTTFTVTGNTVLDGDLTVDTDTLYVDSANDRVGINNTGAAGYDLYVGNGLTGTKAFALNGQGSSSSVMNLDLLGGGTGNPTGRIAFSSSTEALSFSTGDNASIATAMTINSSQRVLIGQTIARNSFFGNNIGTYNPRFQIEANNTSNGARMVSFVMNDDSNNGFIQIFGRSRGTTANSLTAVAEDDNLGIISWQGATGSSLTEAAQIKAEVDGAIGSADMPGRLVFRTTGDGNSSSSERMRITNAGDIGIGETDPDGKLDISVSGSNSRIHTINPANGIGDSQFGFKFRWGNSANSPEIGLLHGGSFADAGLYFDVLDTNVQRRAMTIDSSQRVLIGLTTSAAVASVTASDFQVETGGIGASIVSTAGAAGPAGVLALGHKRGAGGIVLDDDALGEIRFSGHDGSDLVSEAAKIRGSVDGTPGSNDMPGRLEFYTTSDGASSPTERMRIDSSGDVGINVTANTTTALDVMNASADTNQRALNLRYNGGMSSGANEVQLTFSNANPNSFQLARIASSYEGGTYMGSLRFYTNSNNDGANLTEAMRIDQSQRVLIGTNSSIEVEGYYRPKFQVAQAGTTDNAARGILINYGRNNAGGGAAVMYSRHSGTTVGSEGNVANDYNLGENKYTGWYSDNYYLAANIKAEVDGTPSSADMPGRIVFSTTADGASSPTERWRINSYGNLSNGGGDRADLGTGFNINQGATLSLFAITHTGGVFSSEVMVHMSANDGYAGRVVRGIWYVRKAVAGSAHSWVELSNTSLGSVNSGVVSVPTITVTTEDAGSNIFKLKVSYSGAGATCLAKATITGIGDSARTLRELN